MIASVVDARNRSEKRARTVERIIVLCGTNVKSLW